jgi:MFS family permease
MPNQRRMLHFLLFQDTLTEFYLMLTLRNFGLAMINLFLPIFIYTLRNSFLDLIIFLFFVSLALTFFFPFAGKIASKLGAGHTMLFSAPFTIAFFSLLYFFDPLSLSIPFLGFLFGFSEAFFWMAFHIEFASISKPNKVGKEVGLYRVITIMTALVGPLFGGLVIAFFWFSHSLPFSNFFNSCWTIDASFC